MSSNSTRLSILVFKANNLPLVRVAGFDCTPTPYVIACCSNTAPGTVAQSAKTHSRKSTHHPAWEFDDQNPILFDIADASISTVELALSRLMPGEKTDVKLELNVMPGVVVRQFPTLEVSFVLDGKHTEEDVVAYKQRSERLQQNAATAAAAATSDAPIPAADPAAAAAAAAVAQQQVLFDPATGVVQQMWQQQQPETTICEQQLLLLGQQQQLIEQLHVSVAELKMMLEQQTANLGEKCDALQAKYEAAVGEKNAASIVIAGLQPRAETGDALGAEVKQLRERVDKLQELRVHEALHASEQLVQTQKDLTLFKIEIGTWEAKLTEHEAAVKSVAAERAAARIFEMQRDEARRRRALRDDRDAELLTLAEVRAMLRKTGVLGGGDGPAPSPALSTELEEALRVIAELREEIDELRRENDELRRENDELRRDNDELRKDNNELLAEMRLRIPRLTLAELEEARRSIVDLEQLRKRGEVESELFCSLRQQLAYAHQQLSALRGAGVTGGGGGGPLAPSGLAAVGPDSSLAAGGGKPNAGPSGSGLPAGNINAAGGGAAGGGGAPRPSAASIGTSMSGLPSGAAAAAAGAAFANAGTSTSGLRPAAGSGVGAGAAAAAATVSAAPSAHQKLEQDMQMLWAFRGVQNLPTNWHPSTPLHQWTGVTLDTTGRVERVDLSHKKLKPFDEDFCMAQLLWRLPSSVREIKLNNNSLGANGMDCDLDATQCLAHLSALEFLDVQCNGFPASKVFVPVALRAGLTIVV